MNGIVFVTGISGFNGGTNYQRDKNSRKMRARRLFLALEIRKKH
jgi:hypothetical protein